MHLAAWDFEYLTRLKKKPVNDPKVLDKQALAYTDEDY